MVATVKRWQSVYSSKIEKQMAEHLLCVFCNVVNFDALVLPRKIRIFFCKIFPWVFSPKVTAYGVPLIRIAKKHCIVYKDHPNLYLPIYVGFVNVSELKEMGEVSSSSRFINFTEY